MKLRCFGHKILSPCLVNASAVRSGIRRRYDSGLPWWNTWGIYQYYRRVGIPSGHGSKFHRGLGHLHGKRLGV